VVDFLGGQVPVLFAGAATAIEHIKAGRLRALGVTSATRLEALPDLPAVPARL
jgi:tripartite-type tricarboxylate transporter receptor subunit TctC